MFLKDLVRSGARKVGYSLLASSPILFVFCALLSISTSAGRRHAAGRTRRD